MSLSKHANYRIRVIPDLDRFGDEWDFIAQTEKEFDELQARHPDGTLMSWEEYQRTWGDIDNYEVFGSIVEKQCPCCGNWDELDVPDNQIWGTVVYWPDSDMSPGVYTIEQAEESTSDLHHAWVDYLRHGVEQDMEKRISNE